jgi:hypothetical protein
VSKRRDRPLSGSPVGALDQGDEPEASGDGPGDGCDVVKNRRTNEQIAPRLLVGPACLLFFIDETGHETFADKNYPVFGLGGCAITSSAAEGTIAKPWRAMKAEYFGGENVPLHANELRNPTSEQLAALAKFFREQQFARLAVTMSKSAVPAAGTTPFDIVAGALINRYRDLLSRVSPEPNEVAFLHEASDRCDQLVEKHLGGTVVQINHNLVPVHKGLVGRLARTRGGRLHHACCRKKGRAIASRPDGAGRKGLRSRLSDQSGLEQLHPHSGMPQGLVDIDARLFAG